MLLPRSQAAIATLTARPTAADETVAPLSSSAFLGGKPDARQVFIERANRDTASSMVIRKFRSVRPLSFRRHVFLRCYNDHYSSEAAPQTGLALLISPVFIPNPETFPAASLVTSRRVAPF